MTRAYSQAAKNVLDVSKAVTVHVKQRVSVSFPFDFTGEIMRVVNRFGLDIVKQDYSADGIYMELDVPVAKVRDVGRQVTERSGGKVGVKD